MTQQKGAIVLSIDDGTIDHYRLFHLLDEVGVPATFNIITERIGRENYLTKEQIVEIHRHPLMEIASHSHSHKNEYDNITLANETLFSWLGIEERQIGFASPGSDMKRGFIIENEKSLRELGLIYARSSQNPAPSEHQVALAERLEKEGASPWLVRNVAQLVYRYDSMFVPSAVVLQHTTLDELKALADLAEREHACIVIMLHRVEKVGEPHWENLWCFDYDITEAFLRYIKEKEEQGTISLLTTRESITVFSK